MRRALFLIFFFFWAAVGHAYVQPEIVYLEAKLSPVQEKAVQRGIAHMMTFYDRIGGPVPVNKINLRLFRSPKAYRSYRDEHGRAAKSDEGYYSVKKNEIVVSRSGNFVETILHESNHLLFGAHFPKGAQRTVWIDEGLANYPYNATY